MSRSAKRAVLREGAARFAYPGAAFHPIIIIIIFFFFFYFYDSTNLFFRNFIFFNYFF